MLTESLLASKNNNYYSLATDSYSNINKNNQMSANKDEDAPLNSSNQNDAIQRQETAISMSADTVPTNMNVINALRHKASKNKSRARVDNVFLYQSIPKFGDMFIDHQTSAITLLHIGFAALTIILIIIGYVLQIEMVWKYGTFLCLVTNIFGITHSMHSGSISNKMDRLDSALQHFAFVIQKFAKALDIQEQYLNSVKNILDFLDHHILLIQHKFPNDKVEKIMLNNDEQSDEKGDLLKSYHDFFGKLKEKTVVQHKKWLLTFFCQYKLLDNRFGITKMEYLDFIHKLPNKTRTFFQSLTGIHARFKPLDDSNSLLNNTPKKGYRNPSIGMDIENQYKSTKDIDEELGANTVLLYKDMSDLVYKVHDDVGSANSKIEQELAKLMLSKQQSMMGNNNSNEDHKSYEEEEMHSQNKEFMLSHKMSVSLARDTGQAISPFGVLSPPAAVATKLSSFGSKSNSSKYYKMSDDSDDELSRTIRSSHRNLSISNYTSKTGKRHGVGDDDVWLKRVMTDLKVADDLSYDYSENSHKL